MLDRFGQFYRCTRNVPPRQLLRRLSLTAKRRTLRRLPSALLGRRTRPLPLASTLPIALHCPRMRFAKFDRGIWWANQLNRLIPIGAPVDWSASGIEVDAHGDAQAVLVCGDETGGRRPTHLERLTFHYHEFIEALPTEVADAVILDWIDNNPPYQGDYWNDCWNSYAISIRCVVWMQWWSGERNSNHDAREGGVMHLFEQKMFGSLCEQVRFLANNLETDICGNHLIKNIRCLLWAGSFFQGKEAEYWVKIGLRHLWCELDRQFLADGMHYELSPSYHCQVLGDLLDCANLLDKSERERLLRAIEPMIQCMRLLTHPDGQISLFSDGGLNMVYLPAEYERVWQRLCGNRATEENEHSLAQAGYYRICNDRVWLLVDCGPICADALPAHGHADMLSFELDIDGKRMIVDRGVFEYEAGDARNADRSAVGHNTLTIAGRDQCELVGSFRTGRRSNANCESFVEKGSLVELVGSHTGFSKYKQEIVHRRTLVVTDGKIAVVDQVESDKSDVAAVVRFRLHHECQVDRIDPCRVRVIRDQTTFVLSSDWPISIVRSAWSPNFGQRIPTNLLEITSPKIPCFINSMFQLE